jgi:CheY-like chemotaxis protein
MPATRGHATGRAILTGRPVHIPDVRDDPEYELAGLRDTVRLRTVLSVPMLRGGRPIGAITAQRWGTTRPFSAKQMALLETFAEQAVIAIENVRLFTELEARNRELTETLEQQTATSEILRVISQSQTNVQPVFDTIVANAVTLCGARMGAAYRFDGELLHLVAHHNYPPGVLEVLQQIRSDERLKLIPVVVLTSSHEERDMVASYKLGVNAYVVKPVDFHEFVNAVKELGVFWAVINQPPPGSVARRS